MESLPPNDPNRNNGNNQNNGNPVGKDAPFDGRGRQRDGSNNNGTMDFFGNLEDQPVVVMMFLVGVATWFLRERCIC
eukprot:scaffold1171_cov177-Amphora_coffeaeformis.AAC.5